MTARTRNWRTLALVLSAVALAWLAQYGLSAKPSTSGPFYAVVVTAFTVASILFVSTLREVALARFALGRLADAPASHPQNKRKWWLIGFAALAMGGSLVLFGLPAEAANAWNLHLVSIVRAIYTSTDPEKVRQLLEQYGVSYIYAGQLERLYYAGEGLDKFEQLDGSLWTRVYDNEQVKIYQVK